MRIQDKKFLTAQDNGVKGFLVLLGMTEKHVILSSMANPLEIFPQKHFVFCGNPFGRCPLHDEKKMCSFLQEISFRKAPMAFFSRRETCACEIPTSAEISVCVFPS